MISVQVDIKSAIQGLDFAQRRQVPFAASRAINDVALSARRNLLAKARSVFKFRTNPAWINSTSFGWFRTIFSNKANLTAYIEGIRDYLFLQIYSGVRTKKGGGLLAVPLGDLAKHAIPRQMKPKYLLGNDYRGLLAISSDTKMASRKHQKAVKSYGSAFIFETNGKKFIVQRNGPKKLTFLYLLVPAVSITGRLPFEALTRETVNREFNIAFAKRFNEALATAR